MTVSFKHTELQLVHTTHEDVSLESVDYFKLLGMWVFNNMTWKYQVKNIYAIAIDYIIWNNWDDVVLL